MNNKGVLVAFLILFYGLNAQKILKQTIPIGNISFLQINSENCYKVKLSTHNSNEIILAASLEGEYQNDIVVSSIQEGATLFLETKFQMLFNNPNDKLSAHKIVSVFLDIVLPKGLSVKLLGNSTKIDLSGEYNKVEIHNIDENIILQNVEGNILAKSFSGSIILNIESGEVSANSKFGSVYSGTILKGKSNFIVNTVNGSIYINKEE